MSLATSDGSRLWYGDTASPFPPSGNEGHERSRDVPPFVGHFQLYCDDIGGPWKVP